MKTNDSSTFKGKGKTNWGRVKNLTDAEIAEAAKSDPDAPLFSKEQLKSMGFKRVDPVYEVDVKFIRRKLNMSQEEFAQNFGFNKRTLEGWEQHRREPTGAAKLFLKVIEVNPGAVSQALGGIGKLSSSKHV
jgi:putative transcriptional regulator